MGERFYTLFYFFLFEGSSRSLMSFDVSSRHGSHEDTQLLNIITYSSIHSYLMLPFYSIVNTGDMNTPGY